MKIQTFKNMKGLIHGANPVRISCDMEGVLKIGDAEIKISPGTESIVPILFNGYNGFHAATFTDANGNTYELEKVEIRGGRIAPPSQTAVEFMDLRCHLDEMEETCSYLKEQINFLANIFDTDSLNFLTK